MNDNKLLDQETFRLFENMGIGSEKWNVNFILGDNFKELDSYRIYNMIALSNKMELNNDLQSKFLEDTHLFTIDKQTKYSLENHKPIKLDEEDIIDLPFNNLFLDVVLDGINEKYFGFHLFFPFDRIATKMVFGRDDIFYISSCAYDKQKNRLFTILKSFSLKKGLLREDNKRLTIDEKLMEKFIANTILFFNEPRVTKKIYIHNNERRIRHGKMIIPKEIKTIIRYDLQEYMVKIYDNRNARGKLNFAYWVRGHKRRLMSDWYKEKKTIWVKAHLVGEGLIPPHIHQIQSKGGNEQ